MTKAEFQKFFRYISSVTTDTNPSPERTQVYWDLLNDLEFEVAMVGGKRILATLENPFLPMPAVFRKAALEVTGRETLPWPEAYDQVLRAIRNFGVHRVEQALDSLTPINRATLNALGGFKAFCLNEENDINRAQFRMAYETLAKREMMDANTPQKLKELMAGMGNSPVLELPKPKTRNLDGRRKNDEELEGIVDIDANSDQIRELLARVVKNRRKQTPESRQNTKMSAERAEEFHL
ncbi:hypothetical protein [Desulfosporosinus burensis]